MPTRIFISHKHAESPIAGLLTEFLLSALAVDPESIRCSSIPGHQLHFGTPIEQQLKDDIASSGAIFVLLTRESLNSAWVLSELGASWGLGKIVVPVLGPKLGVGEVFGPIAHYPCLPIDDAGAPSRLWDAVDQVAAALGVLATRGPGAQTKLDAFVGAFRAWPPPAVVADVEKAKAFEISWLLMVLLTKGAKHPAAVLAEVTSYLGAMAVTLPHPVEAYLDADDEGTSAMRLMETIGGQIKARKPGLVPYFEAGMNLLLDAARNQGRGFAPILARLGLPGDLLTPRENPLEWANQVHFYFENVIRSS